MDPQPPVPPKPTSSMVMWIVLIIILILVAGGIYWWWQRGETDRNSRNTEVNVAPNTNSSQITRPAIEQSINQENEWTIFSSADIPFEIQFPPNWYFTMPKPDHPKYSSLIVTASNENADGTERLSNTTESLIALLTIERTSVNIPQYLTENPVSPKDLSLDRVVVDSFTTAGLEFTRRTIDATNLPNWSSTYSVEYILKSDQVIYSLAFAARSKAAIDNNQATVISILQSIK